MSQFGNTNQSIGVVTKQDGLESAIIPPWPVTQLYSARSKTGDTYLSSCAVGYSPSRTPNNDLYLYLTGYSTGELFKRQASAEEAWKDLVALYIDSSNGSVRRGVQFRGPDSLDLAGVSLDVNKNGDDPGLRIGAQQWNNKTRSGSTMTMYKLDLDNLTQLAEPDIFKSYSQVNARSIAASPKFTTATKLSATFLCGDGYLTKDRKEDIACSLSCSLSNSKENTSFPLYCTLLFIPEVSLIPSAQHLFYNLLTLVAYTLFVFCTSLTLVCSS